MAVFPFNLKCSAVILMVVALLAGVAFALGHDAFYQSLNGKPVVNGQPLGVLNSSLNLSDQQVYVSLGTFFAFLVKSSLGLSVSTVFDQSAWKSIQGHRTGIGTIDDLLSVLKNGFTILNLQLWKRFPISMTLAVIVWLLPVASMISPATLSVHLASFDQHSLRRIPRVDFTSANFADLNSALFTNSTGQNGWLSGYSGPTPETQRVVNSVATQGTILPIEPPAVNSSWSVEFHGPSIVCDNVNSTLGAYITQNVAQAMKVSELYGPEVSSLTRYGYLSWAPESDDPKGSTPFYQVNGNDTYIQRSIQLGPELRDPEGVNVGISTPTNPFVHGAPLSLFVAIFPRAMEYAEYDSAVENVDKAVQNSTILRCLLHNASYQADLTYINREQTINVINKTILNGVGLVDAIANYDNGSLVSSNLSFIHNPQLMECLSYQSLMEAFGSLLFGSIKNFIAIVANPKSGTDRSFSYSENPNTSIISTRLMETEEMRSIQFITSSNISSPFTDYWKSRSNVTFSLMSSKMFQPNYTMNDMPETNVTITSYRNIYVYTRSILWAAYGTALGATALSLAAGILLYFTNDGSYSSKFSTIFRITQGAVVSTDLSMKDYSGLDPLPDHIANAKMTTGYHSDYDQGNPVTGSPTAHLRHPHRESEVSS
ncbi:hypothetical protein N7453_008049 [Penicillium expansum]|nr:hypothetical protein N7453_008049 [Penicillium expansum]